MKKLKYLLMALSMMFMFMGGAYFAVPSLSSNSPKDNDYVVETIAPSEGEIDDDNDDITEYIFKTKDSYYADFEIPTSLSDISQTTITGRGTETDPYVVNSTDDFVFLSNFNISYAYVELNSDVILNDEKFDKDGNPSGGDRTVYKWNAREWTKTNINGNGHSISGCYIDDEEKAYCAIFSYIGSCENISIDNFYIKGGSSSLSAGFASYVKGSLNNVQARTGYVYGGKYASGVSCQVDLAVTNCVNYAYVKGDNYVGGVVGTFSKRDGYISGCVNYGMVEGTLRIGGIIGRAAYNCEIEFCENQGQVYTSSYHSGGIVGVAMLSKVLGCVNYGKIICGNSTSYVSGGIVACAENSLDIIQCENYGEIWSSYLDATVGANILGYIAPNSQSKMCINVIECSSLSSNDAIVGSTSTAASTDLITINIESYKGKMLEQVRTYLICRAINGGYRINISNVQLEVFSNDYNAELFPSSRSIVANINNLYVKISCDKLSKTALVSQTTKTEVKINSTVVQINVEDRQERWYYGDSFSGYYMSWKTGKIGLVALDGRGQFNSMIDEEMLIAMGYNKKG